MVISSRKVGGHKPRRSPSDIGQIGRKCPNFSRFRATSPLFFRSLPPSRGRSQGSRLLSTEAGWPGSIGMMPHPLLSRPARVKTASGEIDFDFGQLHADAKTKVLTFDEVNEYLVPPKCGELLDSIQHGRLNGVCRRLWSLEELSLEILIGSRC